MRAICESVVTSTLEGKAWNGEEETVWAVSITENIKAKVRGSCIGVAWEFTRCLLDQS